MNKIEAISGRTRDRLLSEYEAVISFKNAVVCTMRMMIHNQLMPYATVYLRLCRIASIISLHTSISLWC